MKQGKILAAGAVLALAATTMAQTAADGNYAFPAPWNPAGRQARDVPQFIAITWDDNAYSGLNRTGYEPFPGAAFAQQNFIGGMHPDENAPGGNGTWGQPGICTRHTDAQREQGIFCDGYVNCKPNRLRIYENNATGGRRMMGMNWSINADAFRNNVPMTYFMLAGFYVDVWSSGTEGTWDDNTRHQAWQDNESRLGFLTGEEVGQPWVNSGSGYRRLPVAWGREGGVWATRANEAPQRNTITRVSLAAVQQGHEIASHSIDHKETNSWLRNDSRWAGFHSWGGEGYRNSPANQQYISGPNREIFTTLWGQPYNMTAEFGQAGRDLDRGWIPMAGRQLSENAWHGAIKLADDWIMNRYSDRDGGLGLRNNARQNTVRGFRAPRLESNSNMFYALKRAGYVYSSSLEGGFESHIDGRNFLWPYTTDNGVRNTWVQADRGARVFHDTMPTGIWEIPINVVIVPENRRASVVENWNRINDALNAHPGGAIGQPNRMNAATWDGKITAFDFNLWILYGMTAENFQATMRHTVEMRMAPGGNRAPLNYGTHTDYYTPVYDFGTLMNPFNRSNFGLIITGGQTAPAGSPWTLPEGVDPQLGPAGTPSWCTPALCGPIPSFTIPNNAWNSWTIRQDETERWVDWAKSYNPIPGSRGVQFVSSMQLIDSLRAMNREGERRIVAANDRSLNNSDFRLYWGGRWGTVDAQNRVLAAGNMELQAPTKGSATEPGQPQPVFVYEVQGNELALMTHISLSYKSRTATSVRLVYDNNDGRGEIVREAILAHRYSPIGWEGRTNQNYERGEMRNSGRIPLTSFDFEEHFRGTRNYSAINPANIKRIEIAPLAPANVTPLHGQFGSGITYATRTDPYNLAFTISNIRIHSAANADSLFKYDDIDLPSAVANASVMGRTLSLAGISNNALKLNIAQTGKYDVKVFTANGRLIQSFNATNLTAGVNTLKLNNLGKGVYMIKIQGIDNKQTLTRSALVL